MPSRVSRTTNELSPDQGLGKQQIVVEPEPRTAAAIFVDQPGRSVREIRHEHRTSDGRSGDQRSEREPFAVECDHRKPAIDAGVSTERRVGAALQIPHVQLGAARSCGPIRERIPVARHAEIADDASAAGQTSRLPLGRFRSAGRSRQTTCSYRCARRRSPIVGERRWGRTRSLRRASSVPASQSRRTSSARHAASTHHGRPACRPPCRRSESPVQATAIEMTTEPCCRARRSTPVSTGSPPFTGTIQQSRSVEGFG